MTDLVSALQEQTERTGEAKTVVELLERMEPEIAKALPDHLTGERFRRIVLTELRRTPKLLDCTPASLLGAIMLSAQLGLEPGPLGHVYLVPFKHDVTLIIGYRGMIDLSYRSGKLKSIRARTVYANDGWSFYTDERGDHFKHTPNEGERGEPRLYYANANLTTGGHVTTPPILPDEIEATRKRSKAGDNPLSPWTTDYDAMARKTAIRRLFPMLPVSPMLAQALAVDGEPAPMIDDAVDADA